MKKRWFIIPIILLGMVAIGLVGEAWAVPPFPHTFYGTVKKDGANVPDGTVISAWIGGEQYVSTNTFTSGADSVYTLNVPGDDPETSAKEGGVNGEIISFYVGSQMAAQTAIYSSGSVTQLNVTVITLTVGVSPSGKGSVTKSPDQATYVYGEQVTLTATGIAGYTFSNWSGDASGTTNPITITMKDNTTVTANFVYSLKVSLKAGYNLVSFPTISGEILITDLLSSIRGEYEMVYAYEGCDPAGDPWKIYDPGLPFYANDLEYIDSAMGIWIEAKQDTELTVEGLFPSSLSIPLCAGWNLISYGGEQAKPVAEALSSISGKYERVYSYRADDITDPWKIYDISVPSYVNDLTTMEPGLGYWIYINENCTLAINN